MHLCCSFFDCGLGIRSPLTARTAVESLVGFRGCLLIDDSLEAAEIGVIKRFL